MEKECFDETRRNAKRFRRAVLFVHRRIRHPSEEKRGVSSPLLLTFLAEEEEKE